ncbi:MAG: DNA primase [Candidatus Atribacteria bacterium]|nr:DNA primase [Candidatus Atribacteria bacterium]MBE3126737.1 DNA primase [Candidatus Atribacteria bacterium]
MRFSSDLLEEIRNRCDIVDIISEYVHLKPAGKGFKGLCPFHGEKTPSFMVSPEKQLFHCFGCGEGGNVFNFLMKYEKFSFFEAVEMLAKKSGVSLPVDEEKENLLYRKKERLYKLNNLAANYYRECLFRTNQGKKIINYLKKRGINDTSVERYRLGYAPTGWDALTNFLKKNGYTYEELIKAGLIKKSKIEGKYIDYFRDRIIFPIFHLSGRVIGFGGRVLDDSLPKYINSPETLVYNKGSNLYNLNFAKEDIRKKNYIIIVEGYTDVLITQQYEFNNVAASLGTALTAKQIDLIKRFTDTVLIAYDADSAGNMAALRSLDLLVEAGLGIKVLALPQGYDPADFLIKKGIKPFQSLIDRSLSLIDYKLKLLYSNYSVKTIEGKVKVIKGILPTLSVIGNEVELRAQTKKISEELKLSEEAILIELKKYKRGFKDSSHNFIKLNSESGNIKAEKILIGCMLENEQIAQDILKKLKAKDFSVLLHRQIVTAIEEKLKDDKAVDSQKVIDCLNDDEAAKLISKILIEETMTFDEKIISGYIDTINNFKLAQERKNLEKRAKILDEKIKKSEKIEEDDLKELREIVRQLKSQNIN